MIQSGSGSQDFSSVKAIMKSAMVLGFVVAGLVLAGPASASADLA